MLKDHERMQPRPFPGCCTAMVFTNFLVLDEEDIPARTRRPKRREFEKMFVEWLRGYQAAGLMVAATTINTQKNANKLLRAYGFHRTAWKPKPNTWHPETKLALWWFDPSIGGSDVKNLHVFK